MNESNVTFGESSGFESRNCVDIWIDGPGDTTVRPCPPELLPYAMAEREKLIRWGALPSQPQSPDGHKPKESPDGPDVKAP